MDTVSKIINSIPSSLLSALAVETNVDKFSKKLQGEIIFKLLLYCILTEKETSLRGMQSAFETSVFRAFANTTDAGSISYSSISERLSVIEFSYFEKIFSSCVKSYKGEFDKKRNRIIRFDSTIVSLSSKLLAVGYNLKGGDADKYRLLKFTIGYSSIPEAVFFYKDATDNSENVALKNGIVSNWEKQKGQINVFDRGITSRANYDFFTENNITFISRIDPKAKQNLVKENKPGKKVNTDSLTIKKDSWVFLYAEGGKKSKHPVRIIQAVKNADNNPISFVTNIKNITAKEITDIYKSRWDIEIFFKFIKQHLNFSHLISRNENGIKVILYVTMIAAILLLQYKKEMQLSGYKMVKRQFVADLEKNIIYNIVILCGGNAEKAKDLLYRNST